MAQKNVVFGGKGIVGINILDEVISVLHLGEDCTVVTDHCAQQWLLKLETECKTDWMGFTALGVSNQSDTNNQYL